jgi:hypothetical protein
MRNLHDMARTLYYLCPTVKPTWDQLGDVTKSVWIERAQASMPTADRRPPTEHGIQTTPGEQIGLF